MERSTRKEETSSQVPFFVGMGIIWFFWPFVMSALDDADNVMPFLVVGSFELAALLFIPIAAGLWCSSSSSWLGNRAMWLVIASLGAAILVATTIGLVENSEARNVENAAEIGFFVFVAAAWISTATWGMGKLFLTFVARRQQMTIGGLIVGFVALSTNIAVTRLYFRVMSELRGARMMMDMAVMVGTGCAVSGVFLLCLYWRKVTADMTAVLVLIVLALGLPAVMSGGNLPPEIAIFGVFFVGALYGMLRLGMETRAINWRPPDPLNRSDDPQLEQEPDGTPRPPSQP